MNFCFSHRSKEARHAVSIFNSLIYLQKDILRIQQSIDASKSTEDFEALLADPKLEKCLFTDVSNVEDENL